MSQYKVINLSKQFTSLDHAVKALQKSDVCSNLRIPLYRIELALKAFRDFGVNSIIEIRYARFSNMTIKNFSYMVTPSLTYLSDGDYHILLGYFLKSGVIIENKIE